MINHLTFYTFAGAYPQHQNGSDSRFSNDSIYRA